MIIYERAQEREADLDMSGRDGTVRELQSHMAESGVVT